MLTILKKKLSVTIKNKKGSKKTPLIQIKNKLRITFYCSIFQPLYGWIPELGC